MVNKKINGDLPVYSDGSFLSSEYIPDIKSISGMEPQTAEISNASHEADINGLHFDFDIWNLHNEQDTLEVRNAGTVTTADAEFEIFDFSLSSGQKEFLTDVTITIPRTKNEENSYIEWFDPEKNKWRPTSFEISEDENSFILFTDHFSLYRKTKPNRQKEAEEFKDSFRYNIFDVMISDPISNEEYPHLQQLIRLNYATIAHLRSAEFPELTDILEGDGMKVGAIENNSQKFMGTFMSKVMGYVDSGDSIIGNRVKKFIASWYDDSKSVASKFGKYIYAFTALNTVYTVTKQTIKNDGRYEPVLKRNATDIAGTIIGGAAIICAGTAAAPYLAAAGVLITFVPDIYDGVVKSPDNFEVVYHHYLNNDVYLTRDGRFVHSQAMGGEIQLQLDGKGWKKAFVQVLENSKDDPKKLEADIVNLYDSYLDRYFEMSDGALAGYIEQNKEALIDETPRGIFLTQWDSFKSTEDLQISMRKAGQEKYHNREKEMLMENTRIYLYKVIEHVINEAYRQTLEEMTDIVVPYLNQTLIFEVDTGNDGFFCDSRYAINDKYRYSFKFDYIN